MRLGGRLLRPLRIMSVSVTDSDGKHYLRELDAAVVRRIKTELMAADANHDGRINADELKELLKKHKTFGDKEIEELKELYTHRKRGARCRTIDSSTPLTKLSTMSTSRRRRRNILWQSTSSPSSTCKVDILCIRPRSSTSSSRTLLQSH